MIKNIHTSTTCLLVRCIREHLEPKWSAKEKELSVSRSTSSTTEKLERTERFTADPIWMERRWTCYTMLSKLYLGHAINLTKSVFVETRELLEQSYLPSMVTYWCDIIKNRDMCRTLQVVFVKCPPVSCMVSCTLFFIVEKLIEGQFGIRGWLVVFYLKFHRTKTPTNELRI